MSLRTWISALRDNLNRGDVMTSTGLSALPSGDPRRARWNQLCHRSRSSNAAQTSLAEGRLLSVDVESSGLDPARDRLLALGAIAIEAGAVQVGASLDLTVAHAVASDAENILIHRITTAEQLGGIDAADALIAFAEVGAGMPLIGYHSRFDEMLIERATRAVFGSPLPMLWIDLAELAPACASILLDHAQSTSPGKNHFSRPAALDDWLELANIRVFQRHRAIADAAAVAQLFAFLLPFFQRARVKTVADALAAQSAWRWETGR